MCLSCIRVYLVSIAIHAGMPAVAIRHSFETLENIKTTVHVLFHTLNLIGFTKLQQLIFLYNDQILPCVDSSVCDSCYAAD